MTLSPEARLPQSAAFMWDALGPQHIDRVNAVKGTFREVFGVQVFPTSANYDWTWVPEAEFERLTIVKNRGSKIPAALQVPLWCMNLRFRRNVSVWFMCNYEKPYTFFASVLLRLTGAKVFIMQDSKFDDYQRNLPLEVLKWFLYRPYVGAFVSGERTRSYLRFLGLRGPIQPGYNSANVSRLEAYGQGPGPAFEDRAFLFVGRLIPKKNVAMLLEAYASYVRQVRGRPRPLLILGSGPEEADLRARVAKFGLGALVQFNKWTDQPVVLKAMSDSLCLLLPSLSEQFGNVVGEACAVGAPVIVSTNVGARDRLVEEFRNGFSLPATSAESWTRAMLHIGENEALWRQLRDGARQMSAFFDVADFRVSVRKLALGEDWDADVKVQLAERGKSKEDRGGAITRKRTSSAATAP